MSALSPDDGIDWQDLAKLARRLCVKWHTGTDRNGRPAYEHPLEVARRVFEATGSWPAYCSACLHDTLEDTGMPVTELDAFPSVVGDTVRALTRGRQESANAYFQRVRALMLSMVIKLHDVEHNFSPGRADQKIMGKAPLYAGWHEDLRNALQVRRGFCELHPGLDSVCECPRHTGGPRLRRGARGRGVSRLAGARHPVHSL